MTLIETPAAAESGTLTTREAYLFEALDSFAFPFCTQPESITTKARDCLAHVAQIVDELAAMEAGE